jgi:hypothetical protein
MESKGVYSVLKDKWIQKPTREEFNVDKNKIKTKAKDFIYKLKDIKQDFDDKKYETVINKAKKLKAKIKQMRNAGLERGGEFSLENIVFKSLRRIDFMDVINSLKNKAYDTSMSITETPEKNWQTVLLIKGDKLKNRKHRLYITTINKIVSSNVGKIAILSNEIFQVKIKNNQLITKPYNWKNHGAMLSALGLEKNSVVISQEKTPLSWITLPLANIESALNAIRPHLSALEDFELD